MSYFQLYVNASVKTEVVVSRKMSVLVPTDIGAMFANMVGNIVCLFSLLP